MSRIAFKLLSVLLPGLLVMGSVAWASTTPVREPISLRAAQDGRAAPAPDPQDPQRTEETGKRRHRPIQPEDTEQSGASRTESDSCPAALRAGAVATLHEHGGDRSGEAPRACNQPRLRLKLLLGQAP